MMIVNMMLLLSTDEVELGPDQKSRVESLQLKYVLMYQRYLRWSHPKSANAKFAGGLMLLHHADQLRRLHSQRLPV
jgi:hypothetical protein